MKSLCICCLPEVLLIKAGLKWMSLLQEVAARVVFYSHCTSCMEWVVLLQCVFFWALGQGGLFLGMFILWRWPKRKRTNSNVQGPVRPRLKIVMAALPSRYHSPKQVTWPSPKSSGKEILSTQDETMASVCTLVGVKNLGNAT